MNNQNNQIYTPQAAQTGQQPIPMYATPLPEQPIPMYAAPLPEAAPQPDCRFDSRGREKRYMFLRKINSVGNTLLIDILLQSAAAVQVVLIFVIVWMFSGILTPDGLEELVGMSESEMLEPLMLGAMLANAIAMPVSHFLAGYMHSVRNGFDVFSCFRRGKRIGVTFPAATVVGLGAVYAWVFVCMICAWLMPDSFFANQSFLTGNYEGASMARIITTAAYVCIGAPLTEEFLFRGVLLKSLSKYGVPFAVFLSSLLFGIIHGNLYQAPFAFLVGIVLAYVAIRSGNIWRSVIIHFIINSFSTLRDMAILFAPEEYADAVNYGFFGIAGVLVLGAVIILCTCAKRICWQPIDASRNNILLPKVESKVRCKPLFMLLGITLTIVILIYVLGIIGSSLNIYAAA